MTNPAAGSKARPVRANIQGHIVVAQPEQTQALRRLSSITMNQLFLHAKEHGSALVMLDDGAWTLNRLSDHTFTLSAGHPERPML